MMSDRSLMFQQTFLRVQLVQYKYSINSTTTLYFSVVNVHSAVLYRTNSRRWKEEREAHIN